MNYPVKNLIIFTVSGHFELAAAVWSYHTPVITEEVTRSSQNEHCDVFCSFISNYVYEWKYAMCQLCRSHLYPDSIVLFHRP